MGDIVGKHHTSAEAYLDQLNATATRVAASFFANEAIAIHAFSNALAHLAWVLTAKPIPKGRRHIAAAAYASRLMQHAYGAYKLLESGNAIGAEVMLRASLEAAFSAGALANEENFAGDKDFYLRLQFKSTLGTLKPLQDFLESTGSLNAVARAAGERRVLELQAQLKTLEAHQLSKTAAVAKAANMEDYYGREYASQSRVLHSDLEVVLRDHVAMTGDEVSVIGVRLGSAEAQLCIAHLVAFLMETATSLATLLQVDLTEGEKARSKELAEFYGRTLETAAQKTGG